MVFLRSTISFVVIYLVMMIPTYILPWMGSNSSLVNAVGSIVGRGPTPMWWAHAWFLAALVLVGWVRGRLIGKPFLALFPFLAAVFDLVPGLNWLPMVPTIMHLVAIIVGAISNANEDYGDDAAKFAWKSLATISAIALAGVAWFALGTHAFFVKEKPNNAEALTKSEIKSTVESRAEYPAKPMPSTPLIAEKRNPAGSDIGSESVTGIDGLQLGSQPSLTSSEASDAKKPVHIANQAENSIAQKKVTTDVRKKQTRITIQSSRAKPHELPSEAGYASQQTSIPSAQEHQEQTQVAVVSADPQPEKKRKHHGIRGLIESATGFDPGAGVTEHQCSDGEKALNVNGC